MGESLDRMSPSFTVGMGETTIDLPKMAGRVEVELSRRRSCRRGKWVGLVLTLKERNRSKRTRLPESAWGFSEECASLGVNESNLTGSISSAKVGTTGELRQWSTRPASSPALGQGAKPREFG